MYQKIALNMTKVSKNQLNKQTDQRFDPGHLVAGYNFQIHRRRKKRENHQKQMNKGLAEGKFYFSCIGTQCSTSHSFRQMFGKRGRNGKKRTAGCMQDKNVKLPFMYQTTVPDITKFDKLRFYSKKCVISFEKT